MLEGKLDQNNFVYPTWNLEVSKEETSKSISAQTFFLPRRISTYPVSRSLSQCRYCFTDLLGTLETKV